MLRRTGVVSDDGCGVRLLDSLPAIPTEVPMRLEECPFNETETTREDHMLTRRAFTGVVSCAICAITSELIATEAAAQAAPPAATAGVTRKILSQSEGPAPGYETLLVEATIESGVTVARHKHPGIESAYVLEGGFELPVQGQPTRTLKAGDAFQIPPETPHAGGRPGNAKTRVLITYVVEKGKPLASPA
jgi:quercetin dioxygenase-like cupin family protein